MTEKLPAGQKPSAWRWLWVGWLGLFLAIELAAVKSRKAGRTLSANMWRWFPTWGWWTLPAGLLLFLILHLSPLHFTVWPVIAFGAAMVLRIAWVELHNPHGCQICGERIRSAAEALEHGDGRCRPEGVR